MRRTMLGLALTLAAATTAAGQEPRREWQDQPEIAVTATGTVALSPDYAMVLVSVVTREPQASRAGEQNARTTTAVRAALRDLLRVPDDSLPSVWYSVDTDYDRDRRPVGYAARLEALGRAVETARREAEAMARAAGGRLGALIEASSAGATFPVARMRGAMAMAAETPITPPELTVEGTVTARWTFVRP